MTTHNIPVHVTKGWADYALLDSGDFEKLERFGDFITIRPEPQAIWKPAQDRATWEKLAHVKFQGTGSHSGRWIKLKSMPDQWDINYTLPDGPTLTFQLALTGFKHVGIFPEQHLNWDAIYQLMQGPLQGGKCLNVFAYTGAASLAARAAGAETYHVDAIRQVVSWSKRNMESSGLTDIRWVVEDAMKFIQREVKRGKTYEGIIMDPPAFGHGPSGESWKLEKMLRELLELTGQLIQPKGGWLILNTYSLGFSSLVMDNLLKETMHGDPEISCGELGLKDDFGRILPLGVVSKVQYGRL
jgi:23S rRNA (cytosine1962-C5)-methyltransferase